MAAYAALVSVMHIIDQIQNHPHPPISLDKLQIESLTEKVTFLQDFLENYSINGGSKDADVLQSQISDAAYAAEDIIESYIVDHIRDNYGENFNSIDLYQGLQELIQVLDSIKRDAVEIKKRPNSSRSFFYNFTAFFRDFRRKNRDRRSTAAYKALVSIMDFIERVQNDPSPPISLDGKQVQSLTEKFTFLKDFLEGYSNSGTGEAYALEGRIATKAYAVRDLIKAHIKDQDRARSTSLGEKMSLIDLYEGLQKVIQDMDLIKRDVTEIKEQTTRLQDQLHTNLMPAGLLKSHSTTMVGFDDVLIEVMDKLTGQQSSRQVIPIVGMGGIGKTTLARSIYVNSLIVQHFDILAWATISHEYNAKEILLQVYHCLKTIGSSGSLSQMSEDELGEKLYKKLSQMSED